MNTITIYHNPACGTSRNTLALIRNSGAEPEVIEYLKTPPTRTRLQELLTAMGIGVRELLRQKGTPYDELGLADAKWTDDEPPGGGDAVGHTPVPPQRSRAGHLARPAARCL